MSWNDFVSILSYRIVCVSEIVRVAREFVLSFRAKSPKDYKNKFLHLKAECDSNSKVGMEMNSVNESDLDSFD